MAKTIFHEARLETELWLEALCMALYMRNRSPTDVLDNMMTPMRHLTPVQEDASSLAIFYRKCGVYRTPPASIYSTHPV